MELLIFGGLFFLVGGFVLMGLSLALGLVIWAVALVVVAVQSVWRAVR